MRILVLSAWFPCPPDNGAKIRVYHLLKALSARHQVTLVSFAFDTAVPDTADDLVHRVETHVLSNNPFERSWALRATHFLLPDPIVTRPLPKMVQLVQRVMEQNAFDIVIASTEVMAAYALLARPGIVKVLEEHNSFTRLMWERYLSQESALQRLRCWASWQKTRRYEARLLSQFDLCVMVSEQDRMTSLQLHPSYCGPVHVVPNGVDCQRNRPNQKERLTNALIFNGALTYRANHDAMCYFLSQVYPLIQRETPEVSLTITGSTKGVNLADLPLDGSIRLTGYVEDVRSLVAEATVCIVPLREGGGTRLKILEAMALGTPVVATPKGAEGLNVQDGEHLLLGESPQAFADRTLHLMQNESLRQKLSSNARRLVEDCYDWNKIGQQFVALVESVRSRV